MLLQGFGEAGQQKLASSTALLLGCGALGSVSADLLTRAGVGHLVIVDRDFVELSNLQRQVLFDERDATEAIPKAEAARRRLQAVNSQIRITAIVDDINHTNIERLAHGADVLVDGLDNFETRYLANDLAVKNGIPYVYGAAVGTTGMAFTVLPHAEGARPWERSTPDILATPCLRCLFEDIPAPGTTPTCDTVGVISSAVGVIANIQVAETLKVLTGNFDKVSRALLNFDLWANDFMRLDVSGAYDQGDCPCCKHRLFEFLDGRSGSSAASLCGRNSVQLRHRQSNEQIDLSELAELLREHGSVSSNAFMLRAVIEERNTRYEISLFPDGRAIIKGTDDIAVARGIYSRYVGN